MTIQTDCPACSAPVAADALMLDCEACGHRWMNRTAEEHSALDESVYTIDYTGYAVDPRFQKSARDAIARMIVPHRPPPATMLDVGCGAGEFLEGAVQLGYTARGIDISPASAELCRAKGLDAIAGDYLAYDFGQRFDVITMWDVVEHLRDPGAFFLRTRELLNPGGMFVGKVPGFGTLSVELARRVPRTAGILLGAPDHCQYFRPSTLVALAKRSGFDMEVAAIAKPMRTPPTGGPLKRRAGRSVARAIARASGDANIFFTARAAA